MSKVDQFHYDIGQFIGVRRFYVEREEVNGELEYTEIIELDSMDQEFTEQWFNRVFGADSVDWEMIKSYANEAYRWCCMKQPESKINEDLITYINDCINQSAKAYTGGTDGSDV